MAYRGITATIPIGLQGFHGSRNPSKLGVGHLSMAEGLDIDGGVLTKEGGAQKLNSSALGSGASILAGISWSPQADQYDDVVYLSTGAILKDTGGAGTFSTTLASSLLVPSIYPPFFVAAGSESAGSAPSLFCFAESHQVKVVDGTGNTMSDISTPPSDWSSAFPIFGVLHVNRLWGAGNSSDPHRMYYSTTGDHEDFQGSGSGQLPIYPGEGEYIVGALSFSGVLIVWKYPRGIYIVDTTDSTPTNWSVKKLTTAVGGVNMHTIVQVTNDVLFLDSTGTFHLLSATDEFSDIKSSDIGNFSDIGVYIRDNVALANIRDAQAMWYASKSEAWFMMPQVGSVVNDFRMTVDFGDPQIGPRFVPSIRDVGVAAWMRPDDDGVERPTLGDDEGFVWLMDDEERNKDDSAYDFEIETSEIDFGFIDQSLVSVNKNGQFIEIVADVVQLTHVDVVPIWDGVEGESINVPIGSQGAALGSFTFGLDALAAEGITSARHKLPGSGKRLKLKLSNVELDEQLRIAEVRVSVTAGDEGSRLSYGS